MGKEFWLPTRAYNVVDAIRRISAATGSVSYARMAASADYNGHAVSVYWNEHRRYWLAEFYWGERRVLCRGTFEGCVLAAQREHERGALGGVVYARDRRMTDDEAAVCKKLDLSPWSEEIEMQHDASWVTPLHREVGDAVRLERAGLGPATRWLVGSSTVEEYRTKRDAGLPAFAQRRQTSTPTA